MFCRVDEAVTGYGLFKNSEEIVDSIDSTPVSVIDVINILDHFYNSCFKVFAR